jgi:hypothetical protein
VTSSITPFGDGADKVRGHLQPVLVEQEALDLPHCHAPCVQGDDPAVEGVAAALPFLDELRLEGPQPVAGDGQIHGPSSLITFLEL